MLSLTEIFASLVLTLLLTAIIYIFIDNSKKKKFPRISNELFSDKRSGRNLLTSLIISLVLVIIFLLIKFRGRI